MTGTSALPKKNTVRADLPETNILMFGLISIGLSVILSLLSLLGGAAGLGPTPSPGNAPRQYSYYEAAPKTREERVVDRARSYLRSSAFSYEGLIGQLEYSGFTHEEAVYGANCCGADWQEQALRKARSYLRSSAFSYEGLIGQLEYSGFTHEQAVYGANCCGADWQEQAVRKADSYLRTFDFSYSELVEQLEYSGFTNREAKYGADHCSAKW